MPEASTRLYGSWPKRMVGDMVINLVGKFSNTWGVEHLIKAGFESLDHEVNPMDIKDSYGILRRVKSNAMTVVLQGYGLAPKLIESGRRVTKRPWILWHAEVMSPEWPTNDDVVVSKFNQLQQNAYAFDAIGHNCHCCLNTVRFAAENMGASSRLGRQVFWAPNNGVDPMVHRRIEGIAKKYAIGAYGYLSERRVELLRWLGSEGVHVEYRRPEEGCFGEELTRFINQCHCILNFHYSASPNTECRLYEAMGSGVPVISEPISMPELFPDSHCGIMTFMSTDELLCYAKNVTEAAARYPLRLQSVGTAAMEYLHANASYTQRCQNFINQVRKHIG